MRANSSFGFLEMSSKAIENNLKSDNETVNQTDSQRVNQTVSQTVQERDNQPDR